MPPLMAAVAAAAATPVIGSITLGTVLSTVGTGLSLVSAVSGMQTANAQGKAAVIQGNYVAKQKEQQAGQEIAASQRKALETERQSKLVQSRAQNLTGAVDVGTTELIGNLAGQGEYNSLMSLYEGKDRADALQQGADLSRFEGVSNSKSIKAAGRNQMWSTIGSTLLSKDTGDLFSKYAAPSGQSEFFGGKTGWIDWK